MHAKHAELDLDACYVQCFPKLHTYMNFKDNATIILLAQKKFVSVQVISNLN